MPWSTHYIQWTTALGTASCDYSIEKARSNRQTGSTLVLFNIFLQCFDTVALLKNCFFQALPHLNSPYFFLLLLDVRLMWVQVRLIFTAWGNAQIWKRIRKQHASRMITAVAVFNIIDLEIWSFFFHQDKERIAYELKWFSMEKINIFQSFIPPENWKCFSPTDLKKNI